MAEATGRSLVMEPDDAYRWPEALEAKRGLGDYPTAPMARASAGFENLWRMALEQPSRFSLGRRDDATAALLQQPLTATRAAVGDGRSLMPGHAHDPGRPLARPQGELLVKTVNASLCADVVAGWLGARVVVVSRDLRQVVSSWSQLAGFEPEDLHLDRWVRAHILDGVEPPPLPTRLARIAWTVAVLERALMASARAGAWRVVAHEDLVRDPHGKIVELLAALGEPCHERVHAFIDSRRKPGSGFETQRSDQQLDEWRQRLSAPEWAQVDAVLDRIPRKEP